ncbi:MAG TPA: LacI family DNA-binding transcriptional regulator [Bacillota bacterium]
MSNIKDVAKTAGVSIAAVSRILNDPSYGADETRAKVMAAIKQLGYRPNNIARSMVKGKTHLIALVIPDVRNPFFTETARGVEDVANKYDYRVMLCNTDEDLAKQQKYLETFRSKIIDGFIIAVASEKDKELGKMNRQEMPFVLIDRQSPGVGADLIVVDNKGGAYEATRHFIRLGHKKIGIITGKLDTLTGRDRLNGYIAALKEAGLTIRQEMIFDGEFTIPGGYNATRVMLNQSEKPTALFISNNSMMIGALKAISEAGIKIPNDLAIIGFDDEEWAQFFMPPLTVVRQPAYTMGTLAAELLFQRLQENGSSERKEIVLKPELVVRESCGGRENKK